MAQVKSKVYTDEELSKLLWVPSNDMTVYELGEIVEDYIYASEGKSTELSVLVEIFNKKRDRKKFVKSCTYAVDRTHLSSLNDLCEMNSLHEAPLLDILRRRWLSDSMYTYTGEFLISINPYHKISNLNDNPIRYLDLSPERVKFKALAPHVFAIANNALRELINCNNDDIKLDRMDSQSIVVTGESGAGKTEASKLVMNFLTSVNKASSSSSSSTIAVVIKTIILESNSIFEAFGNAKTVRNDNSSRFGKYIKLQYTAENELLSAYTETFLLEKSRLVSVGKNDRNYHIFYQLLRGLQNDKLKSMLKLSSVNDFKILTDGGCTVVMSEEDDKNEFEVVNKALADMGCTDKEINDIWSLLAAILHLGNIKMSNNSDTKHKHHVILDSPTMCIGDIASLLGVDVANFTSTLTFQSVNVSQTNECFQRKLTAEDAKNNIYALIKWVYGGIFNWLVNKINSAHVSLTQAKHKKEVVKFIGILDIFGFEVFQVNTFEQLAINYTNERLQQQFNELAFEIEQQEYAKEGLDWTSISYRDNQSVIDLIGKKPKGLLIVLEEHSLMNREPDDKALLTAFNNLHATAPSNPNYSKARFGNDSFVIKHFAGDVNYAIANFITKNNDSLQIDLSTLLVTSKNSFLLDILKVEADSAIKAIQSSVTATSGKGVVNVRTSPGYKMSGGSSKGKMASTISVSLRFRTQLDSLMSTLRSTRAFYIKCIKPNTLKEPGTFDGSLVLAQLRYSGVLEIVRIRREGYPTRMQYAKFYKEYAELAYAKKWFKPDDCEEPESREYCRLLLDEFAPDGAYQFGRTYLFLHHYVPQLMLDNIQKKRGVYATRIQAWYTSRVDQLNFRQKKRVAIKIQSMLRMAKIKRETKCILAERKRQFQLKLAAHVTIQSAYRRFQQKTKFSNKIKALITIQSFFRSILQMRRFQRIIQASILIQAQTRTFLNVKFKHARRAIVLIQAFWRGKKAVAAYKTDKAVIVKLQSLFRGYRTSKKYRTQVKGVVKLQATARQRFARNCFASIKAGAIVIEACIRRYLQLRRYKKSLWAINRLQVCIKRWFRNQQNLRLICSFHSLCEFSHNIRSGTKELRAMITEHPELLHIKNKWNNFCTPYHSAALGGNVTFFEDTLTFPLTKEIVLEKDINGDSLLHYIASCPNPSMPIVQHCLDVINAIETKKHLDCVPVDEDDDEEDEFPTPSTPGSPSLHFNLPILKCGYLKKYSSLLGFTTWRKRWVVLTDETLQVLKGAKNKKIVCLIQIEGCKIDRVPGKDLLISVTKPLFSGSPVAKKTMFGTEGPKPTSLILKAPSESVLLEWLKCLKSAAGVVPFRENAPIKYYNCNLREQWVQLCNKKQKTALHVLVEKQFKDDMTRNSTDRNSLQKSMSLLNTPAKVMSINYDDDIILSGWLIEAGCKISHIDCDGKTALELSNAVDNGSSPLTDFLKMRSTDVMRRSILASPDKSKGFSYVQIEFQKLYFYNSNSRKLPFAFDSLKSPHLTVSLCNSQHQPVEPVQTIHSTCLKKSSSLWFGCTFHMQTPLENIGNDFVLLISLYVDDLCKYKHVFHIDKNKLDSGSTTFTFVKSSGIANIPVDGSKRQMTPRGGYFGGVGNRSSKMPLLGDTIESCLDADIVITKQFRETSLTNESYITLNNVFLVHKPKGISNSPIAQLALVPLNTPHQSVSVKGVSNETKPPLGLSSASTSRKSAPLIVAGNSTASSGRKHCKLLDSNNKESDGTRTDTSDLKNTISTNTIDKKYVQLACPGKKVYIRDSPQVDGSILGSVRSGEILLVHVKTDKGYFKLYDRLGYVNKLTKGVEWKDAETISAVAAASTPPNSSRSCLSMESAPSSKSLVQSMPLATRALPQGPLHAAQVKQ